MGALAARLGRVLAWTVVTGVVLLLVATVAVPAVVGGRAYTVLTGSMEPSVPPGTVVVVRPVEADEIGVGSVITYQLHSGRPTVVTHRVHAQGVAADGDPVFWTKGDANDAVDAEPVRPVQVRGEVWYSVPWVGHVGHLLPGQVRAIATLAAAVGLLVYAGWMFVGAARDRRRARAREASSGDSVRSRQEVGS